MKGTQGKQSKTRSQSVQPESHTHVYSAFGAPVYYKKRKKRGSSRASRRIEDVENRATKALHRVTKAVNKGVDNYIDKRDKSARKRRDGALVDFYENASVGISRAMAESSPVLTDMSKAINTRRLRKSIRRAVRGIPVLW
jgi:vacuolar-type H+-ATPase subunit H